MNFLEHVGKNLLREAGIAVPEGGTTETVEGCANLAARLGPCMVKAQVPRGKRGKAGGIRLVDGAEQARLAASEILGMEIGGHRVDCLLVERQQPIDRELYAAVMNDPASKSPVILFSNAGGMDIEEVVASHPAQMRRQEVDIRTGLGESDAARLVAGLGLGEAEAAIAEVLTNLYTLYRRRDAELLEINPLAVLADGNVVALDCKFVLDDSAIPRQPDIAQLGSPDPLTGLEQKGQEMGLKYIELEGSVGLLANGAGLTMTTMDAVRHFGGAPANFMEVGGDAYLKAKPALELVLSNPNVRSLVVNFCGAFARTDVMADGVIQAWQSLRPDIPVFFSIHGTGDVEARQMVRERLGLEPLETMDEAIQLAVEAAR